MIDQYPPANGVLTSLIWRKTAAGSETSLSGYDNASQALSYTPGQEQVYLNGILLVRGSDYTATNGTSITSLTALAVDDFVQINCYNNFSVASVPAASITGEVTNSQITSLATTKLTGTITNAQLAGSISNDKLTNSSITINGSAVALGGSVSLAGDIESVTAGTGISGGGSSGAVTITNSMATAIDAKGDLIIGTGADTFSKLGVGANGTVLTAASGEATGLSWATPAAAGSNWSLLNSGGTSLSGSEVSITGISGKDKLMVIVTGASLNSNTGAGTQIRFNSDSGANYGYAGSNIYLNSANTFAANRFESINNVADTVIPLCNAGDNASDTMNGYLLINGCNSAGVKIFNLAGAATVNSAFQQQKTLGGFYSGTSTISSVQIRTSSTFDAGTVYIYGSA